MERGRLMRKMLTREKERKEEEKREKEAVTLYAARRR